jgi:hypothetical protein
LITAKKIEKMKNILSLCACFCLLAHNISAQIIANPQTVATDNALKNAPKTIVFNTFSAKGTAKNYTIQQPKRNAPPIKWLLDKEGKLLETQQLDLAMPDFITLHHKYKYDAQNRFLGVAELEPSQKTLKEVSYNAEGKIASQISYNAENKAEYTNTFAYSGDKDQPIIVITTTDINNKLYSTTTLRHNSKGKIVEEKYTTDKATQAQTKQFTYDDKDQLIELSQFDYREKPMNKVNYKYDTNGNLVEYKQSSADNGISTQYTYVYKYDEKGNWISRAEVEKGFVYVVIQRTITYHD